MNQSSPTSRKRRPHERPAREADRRFALLVALLAPDKRDGARSRPRRGEGDGEGRAAEFDRPPGEGAADELRPRWLNLILLLLAGCAIAAVLFIVAAPFIHL